MTGITTEQVEEVLNRVLDARKRINDERHAKHHNYVEILIDRDRRRQELSDKVRQQVVGWGVIITVTGFLSMVGYSAYHWIAEMTQRATGH
jgi:hypothetical protein